MRLGWLALCVVLALVGVGLVVLGFLREAGAEGCQGGAAGTEGQVASARCEAPTYWRGIEIVGAVLVMGSAGGALAAWRAGTKA